MPEQDEGTEVFLPLLHNWTPSQYENQEVCVMNSHSPGSETRMVSNAFGIQFTASYRRIVIMAGPQSYLKLYFCC